MGKFIGILLWIILLFYGLAEITIKTKTNPLSEVAFGWFKYNSDNIQAAKRSPQRYDDLIPSYWQ